MTRLFIDTPNILWRSLSVGRDPEAIRATDPDNPEKEYWIATAGYGVENALQLLSSALNRFGCTPKDMVFVCEGRNPTYTRKRKVEGGGGYKEGRGKRPARAYSEFAEAQRQLLQFFLELGAATCTQDEVEADDVLAYLAQKTEEPAIVLTHDGDLARLVGTNPKGVPVSVGNNDWLNVNPYGPFPNDLITLYKALVGDASDNIRGAKGFGDKSFLKLLGTYGVDGLVQLEELIVTRRLFELNEQAEADASLRRIVNAEQDVYNSHTLALLYPEAVDTYKQPLKWTYGMVRDAGPMDDHRFRHWYGTRTLVHAGNFKEAIRRAAKVATPFVALDLETTTPEESDAWMEARRTRDSDAGIDVLGSEIVSCGLTFGDNLQHTIYLTHRHDPSDGVEQITLEQLGAAIQHLTRGKRVVAHNAGGFELPVLRNHFQFEGDEEGFLPDVHCTKLLANYANENVSSGLKPSAKYWLGYDQQTYAEVTGGRKMDQLTATHVLRYGTDDTIVTAALYNHLSLRCQLEDTWSVYQAVEIKPMYLQAAAFLNGVPVSLQRMAELEQADDEAYEKAWATLRGYLIEKGWDGSVCPEFTAQIDAAGIKLAYQIVTGRELETRVRTPAKLATLILEQDEHEADGAFATMLQGCLAGDAAQFNAFVKAHFDGEPKLNLNSPKQLAHLMYSVMGLPVRLRNEITDAMRAKGVDEGNPSTDELAIKMALHYDNGGERPDVLKALLALKTVETRRKMFYGPYRSVQHWKDGLVHASFNQCATVTRRYSCSGPNLQQLPKKGEGLHFRELILPHDEGAVVVSLDHAGQELRILAQLSKDPAMLSCFVGDDLRDMHSLTGASISYRMTGKHISYEELVERVHAGDPVAKQVRAMGKAINFSTAYGAQARKISQQLMVSEEDAQDFLEAKSMLFSRVEEWKSDYIERCRRLGYAKTLLGGVRHLRDAFNSPDFRVAGKAERQGPNFAVQGTGADLLKLAMKKLWESRIFSRYDAAPVGPIHDEYLSSCSIRDLVPFIKEMHAAMTQPHPWLDVPIVSSIAIGWNFGQMIEIGEEPDEQKIQEAVEQLRSQKEVKYAKAA